MKNPSSCLKIGKRTIGGNHPPFIIAEMSANHNGSLSRALKIVEEAAKAGADAVKLQTYTADTMTLNLTRGAFSIRDPKSLWYGRTLYDLYREASTPWKWHEVIFKRCRKLGLIGFSTPFDATAVDFLEGLDVPCYKIASFENTDLALIRKVARTGKPVFISTGMAAKKEILEALQAADAAGCQDLVLLKCTSAYPGPPKESNLRTIPKMQQDFKRPVGLSDHTLGIGATVAAIALGAVAIERHFTLSRKTKTVDSAFSLEPQELKLLVTETRKAWQALGKIHYGPTKTERRSLRFKRSLYITEDIKAGTPLTTQNMRAIRPGLGLPPKYLDEIIGKRVKRRLKKGVPLRWDLIEEYDSKQKS